MPTKKKPRSSRKAKATSSQMMENLKQWVRSQGVGYLRDNNITSVGIGYKQSDGKPTKEISIQFTVEKKAAPEVLESLGTTQIPESIDVNGVTVPTDVIQRKFEISLKVVGEATPNDRKQRINPIAPGVSVANRKVTAGTIGGIVFDQKDGTPYVLSNWHVLNGPQGVIGDDVVQPGPFDDNRVAQNRLGKLVRSHLGAAGDCAIASIEDRTFTQEIFALNVKVDKLGEPELGDKVIKSGRTTGVTHGIVNRVHTIAKIDYGPPTGEQNIGAFEIGPDPANPADNHQISMGGDSGSFWIFKASNGKPGTIVAGLHFAGESPGDPNDHAIACYPKSVFEKLEIALTPPKIEDLTEAGGVGYATNFLGPIVNVPKLSATNKKNAVKLNNSEVISYTHFSLALDKLRRFAFWVAWNIDGSNLKKLSRAGIKFVLDSRLPKDVQVGDELYSDNRLDRGHIARRADLLWGGDAEAKRANKDSFFFTNITPQMDNFNQGAKGGIWGRLEDAVFEDVDVDNLRVSLFGGPIFRKDDREFRSIKIPREFFKVLAFMEKGKLKAKAFLLTQNLDQLELLDLNEFKVFQVKLSEIEQRCGFTFPANLRAADTFGQHLESISAEAVVDRRPIESPDDIVWS